MDRKILQALANPLRIALLDAITREVSSPKQLAASLGVSLSTVAYHVRVLRAAGLVEEVETKAVRGSVAHFYEASIRDPLKWVSVAVDETGRTEVAAAVDKSLETVRLAHKRSAERLAKSGGGGLAATVVVANFETVGQA